MLLWILSKFCTVSDSCWDRTEEEELDGLACPPVTVEAAVLFFVLPKEEETSSHVLSLIAICWAIAAAVGRVVVFVAVEDAAAAAAAADDEMEVGFAGEHLIEPPVVVPFLQKVIPALGCGLVFAILCWSSLCQNKAALFKTHFPFCLDEKDNVMYKITRVLCLWLAWWEDDDRMTVEDHKVSVKSMIWGHRQ